MVHQGCGLDDPGIGAFRLRIATFLGAINPAFLLSFADEDHTFWLVELLALLFGKVVLALPLTLRYIRSMLSTSNTTCLLKTSATVCGTLIAAPVAGCLYGQAIRLTAVPF